MVNIDLKTTSNNETAGEKSTDTGLVLVLILTVITLVIYGGLYLYEKSISDSVLAKQVEIDQGSQKINSPDAKKVIDFQNRIKIAGDFVSEKNVPLEVFSEMEKLVVSGSYLDSVEYLKETKSIKTVFIIDNYSDVAKQVANLKGSQYFKNVYAGKSEINMDGKVSVEINMSIN